MSWDNLILESPVEAGQADMTQGAGVDVVAALDAGRAILPLAGIHAGCYELFVNEQIVGIKDLKGKSVAITTDDSTERLFLSSIVAYIGVNPRDMRWIHRGQRIRRGPDLRGW